MLSKGGRGGRREFAGYDLTKIGCETRMNEWSMIRVAVEGQRLAFDSAERVRPLAQRRNHESTRRMKAIPSVRAQSAPLVANLIDDLLSHWIEHRLELLRTETFPHQRI